jgi:hypothetical protein
MAVRKAKKVLQKPIVLKGGNYYKEYELNV